jgi:hypothetical protein
VEAAEWGNEGTPSYAFAQEEYEQILSDVAGSIAPQLGWSAEPLPG